MVVGKGCCQQHLPNKKLLKQGPECNGPGPGPERHPRDTARGTVRAPPRGSGRGHRGFRTIGEPQRFVDPEGHGPVLFLAPGRPGPGPGAARLN